MLQDQADPDLRSLAALFHDEAEFQHILRSAHPSVRIKVSPFLLHSQRAIETALLSDCSSAVPLLRIYKAWRRVPQEEKQCWKVACRELMMMQFSKEAQTVSSSGYGKCKLRRLRESLLPLRELIPEFVVSESDFVRNPFSLFKCTCLSSDNIWVQPPLPTVCTEDRKVAKRAFGTKRSPEAVVHKLELVKVCCMPYVLGLLSRPPLIVNSPLVVVTQLGMPWMGNVVLQSFESTCCLSTWALLLLLDRRVRERVEAWQVPLFTNMQVKTAAIHSAVELCLSEQWSDAGQRTEVMSVVSPENCVYLFVMQGQTREEVEARSLPWGVVLVAM